MEYEVHVKQLASENVITQRTHTTLAQLGDTMHATLASIATSVDPPAAARGAPFAIYYGEPFRPDDIDVEIGIPITPDAKSTREVGMRRLLPGGPVAYTVHVGPYESIGQAYEALYGWLRHHRYEAKGPPREVYLVGPGQGSPAEHRTEIEVPID